MKLMRRTDLADEAHALWKESAGAETALPGVKAREEEKNGCPVTRVDILDEAGARALGKPVGHYVTLDLTDLKNRADGAFSRSVEAVAGELSALLKDLPPDAPVLVVGLGNRAITPDAVGPTTTDHTLVTRHLVEQVPEHFGHLRPVAALAAGVLGTTGMESGELAQAVAGRLNPAAIIAVDALASRSLSRVCTTVQLSDTGIVPGSGVGNHRKALDRHTLGVPVIAVGVPTVVDGATLALDLLGGDGETPDPAVLRGAGADVVVTPRDIDQRVADLSKVVGYAIDLALQPSLTLEDAEMLLS
ncbi:GPR endopeptidase [Flavonifractor sp. An92]|uniref:GPR endopeptidase n=1 Tax=Flavonifractor sp. An92 TaxID=1965666 RepID=UPI000B374F45|nr:GPR endopeptidase [Flavonifractor sp. An92]OUN05766.1 GPR endopeptidase [Flavonifractor sp. An92]